jgi:hypothetical protein
MAMMENGLSVVTAVCDVSLLLLLLLLLVIIIWYSVVLMQCCSETFLCCLVNCGGNGLNDCKLYHIEKMLHM